MHLDANQLSFLGQIVTILAALGVVARVLWVSEERIKELSRRLERMEQTLEQFERRQETRDEAFRARMETIATQVAVQGATLGRIPPPS